MKEFGRWLLTPIGFLCLVSFVFFMPYLIRKFIKYREDSKYIEATVSASKASAEKSNEKLIALKRDFDECLEENGNLKLTLAQKEAQIQELKHTLEDVYDQLNVSRLSVQEKDAQINKLQAAEQALIRVRNELAILKTTKIHLEQKCQEQREFCKFKDAEIIQVKSEAKAQADQLSKLIDEYKQVIQSLQNTISIQKAKEVAYENELSRVNTQELSESSQKLQAKIDELLQENASLNDALNQYRFIEERNKENTLRGHAYEIQIGELLGKGAVSVYYRGIFRGKKDNGIDLIITTDKEILLVQCKNYSTSGTLHHASVSSFCMSIDGYKAPQNLIVRPILVCTDAVSFDWEANAQLRARNIEIRRISFDEAYMINIEQNVQHIKNNNGTLVSINMSRDDECDQDYDPEYSSDDYDDNDYDDDYDHVNMEEELSTKEDDPYGYYLYYGINSPDDFDISNDTPDDFPDDYLHNMTIHASMDDYFEYEGTRSRFYFDDDNDDPE